MNSLSGIAYRFFSKNKFIAASAIFSVAISVTLIITMMLFVFNAKQSLRNEVAKTYGDMDLSVGYNTNQHKTIDEKLLAFIKSENAIEKSSNVLITRVKIDQINSAEIYTVGVDNDNLAKSRYHFSKDVSKSKIILNNKLAKTLNVNKDDTVNIEGRIYSIEELINDYDAAGVTPDIIIMSREDVKRITVKKTGENLEATYILIKVKQNTDPLLVANKVRKQFTDLRVDIAKEDEYVKSNLASLNNFLIVLSVLLLIVTSLLIIANFEMFLYKYKNQFAIMRTLGATSKQLFKIALIQNSVINIIGAICGLFISFLCYQLMQGWLAGLFSYKSIGGSFNFSYSAILTIACIIFVEIFMFLPAYRISKMLPIIIMRENEKLSFSKLKTRKKIGNYLFIFSLVIVLIIIIATVRGENVGVPLVLFSAILLISSLALLMPVYVSSIFKFLLPVIKFLFGRTSYVAIKNVIPQVRKNTFVMMSISIMMIISIFGSATLKTISKNEEQYLRNQYTTNILAISRLGYNSAINHNELNKSIKSIKSVESVTEISTPFEAELIIGSSQSRFDYVLGDINELSREGLLPSVNREPMNSVIFTNDFAQKHHIQIGDEINLKLYSVDSQNVIPSDKLIVSNIVKKIPGTSLPAIIDWSNEPYNNNYTRFDRAFIKSNNTEDTLNELANIKIEYPELQVNSLDQSIKQSKEIFKQRWSIFTVFIFVIMVCVTLGVFETLISNIFSKRKELAVLRIMNIGANGVRTIILTQIILYLLFGIFFGVFTGIFLTCVMNLIDVNAGVASFDFTNMIEIILLMISIAFCVFIPLANKLAKAKISNELTLDNK
jgi:putative ABC transport system permease protein